MNIQYSVITTNSPIPKDTLTEYGKDGWQLVSILRHGDLLHNYFVKNDIESLKSQIANLENIITSYFSTGKQVQDIPQIEEYKNETQKTGKPGRPPKNS